jgi:ligand-binding sensor domain-containing protein/DNA-binding CsgD family transcriptional regulator
LFIKEVSLDVKKLFAFFFTLFYYFYFCQNVEVKGVPRIENFKPANFKNAGKIWQISAAKNGILYLAADHGLLEFDGKKWTLFKGSKGFTRSLFVANDSLIYTGSDTDFGVWKKNNLNQFQYQSLYPKQTQNTNEIEEFWGVYKNLNETTFVSHDNIYILKKGTIKEISAPTKWYGSFESQNKIYFADEKKGLYILENDQLKLLFNYPKNNNIQIVNVYQNANELMVVTRNHGLYTFKNNTLSSVNTAFSEKLKNEKIFTFQALGNQHLAFGTILNGLYITDLQGNTIHHIDKKKGLPNNTILSIYNDNLGNLWCGMDYGLVKIHLNNKFSYFFDYTGNFGTGNSALLWQNRFFLGTNQGLYVSDWDNLKDSEPLNQFKIIPNSEGQVWSLQNIQGEILMGHDQGLFKISAEKVQQLDNRHGVWTMKIYKDQYLLTGNYNGISVYSKKNKEWQFLKMLNGIAGSCNQIEIENPNVLWINIPNYGVARAELDSSLNTSKIKTFNSTLFKGSNINLSQIKNKIQVQTEQQLYTYDSASQKFLISPSKIDIQADADFLNPLIEPKIINQNYLFHPIDNGFAFEKIESSKSQVYYNPTLFRGIEIFNNQETKTININDKIPYRFNNIRLIFVVPQTENTIYQYRFDSDKNWSNWTENNRFEFLNLKEGTYVFYVKAKINDHYNAIKKISFTISPPFYRSWYAYFFYLLLAIGFYFLYRKREIRVLEKQRIALLTRQQKKLMRQAAKFKIEKEQLEKEQLEKEKLLLEQQVKDKTIELAVKAKEDEDKNRLLVSVKEKLEDAQKNPAQNHLRLKEINRILDAYLSVDDHTFEIQMDELHQSFFKNLQLEHPSLSIYDLRLCAYLKTGLNTHEIAEILNVLPSSLYVKRSRLRKKLDLGADDDLYVFLNKF